MSFFILTFILLIKNSDCQTVFPIESISSTRQQICLNGLWKFAPAENLSNEPSSAEWGMIWVPGAWYQNAWWSACPGIEQKGKGKAWSVNFSDVNKVLYERSFSIPDNWKNSAIILDIKRVSTDAFISIDGNNAGSVQWPGGEIDISSFVKPGKRHILKVFVIASPSKKEVFELMGTANAQVKLKQANLSSKGIIGNVFLECRPIKSYISDVFVQTSVRKKELKADIEFTGISRDELVEVKAILEDEHSKSEKQFSTKVMLTASDKQVKSVSWKWENPRLWDIDQPNLYTLKISVNSKQINDEYAQNFGFREFWIDGKDFILNNKKINLRPTSNTPGAGNYQLTNIAIEGLRKSGYNFFEIWPQDISERGMLQYNDVFMDCADRKGVLISAPLPPSTPYIMDTEWQFQWNKPGKKQEWENSMFNELKRVRNHPSVAMWGMNPNFFGHSNDQNPQVIGQRGWIKEDLGWQTNQQAAEESVEMVKKQDPTRPVFNHHGAYTGDVHTLNFYLCLTPLQERIEWLSHYSKFGNMPFMAIEFGTPLENTMLRGRCPFGESIVTEPFFTEYAAIYQGNAAYKTETKIYREEIKKRFLGKQKYQNWQNNFSTNTLPSFQTLQNLFNKETWCSFRTWGISGGMVPWSDAHGWRRKPQANEFVNMPAFQQGQRGTYYKQASKGDLYYFDPTYWEILPSAKALLESNQETLAWIAGSPEKFTEKSHNFKEGQTVEKQVVLINDSRNSLNYEVKTAIYLCDKIIHSNTQSGKLGWAETIRKPLIFNIPEKLSTSKSDGKIVMEATIGEQTHRDTLYFRAFKPDSIQALKLVCFDPLQKTTTMFRKMGFETSEWNGDLSVPAVVIGREVLSGNFDIPADLKEYVSRGGRLLIMAQTPSWFEQVGFRVAKHLSRYVYAVSKQYPILKGIDDQDLCNWNGESTLVESYPDYLNRKIKEGMYGVPYYGWHWGNQGALTSAALEKPHHSSWRPILECEFDLAYSPLMEMNFGKGTLTLCTLDLEDYFETDPVASKLARQLTQYACYNPFEAKTKKVSYVGNESDCKLLERMGLIFSKAKNIDSSASLIIVGNGTQVSEPEITNYLNQGGNILFLEQQQKNGFLGVDLKKNENFSGSAEIPDWEETRGVSLSDLHLRTSTSKWLIDKGCEKTANGLLGKLRIGKGVAVFCQANPENLEADTLTYFRQTRWRQTRLIAQLLSNLGASFQSDELIFGSNNKEAELNLEGEWKAFLVEKMPVTLSVVGGNEDHGISQVASSLVKFDADETQMQSVRVPMAMEKYGKQWSDANGEVVFRKTIEIPETMVGRDLELNLGVVDDFDETYFNGQLVGKTDKSFDEYWGYERKYRIPATLVRQGKNVIAIRVFDRYGSGGLMGSESSICIRPISKTNGIGFYHKDYRTDFKLGDDPYRYFRW